MFPRSAIIALLTGLMVTALAVTAVTHADAGPPPTPHDLALVDAITWGANQSTMAAFLSLGRDKWRNRGKTTGTGMPCAPERQRPGNKMLGFAPIRRGAGVL